MRNKIIKTALPAALFALMSGCTGDFVEVNKDPVLIGREVINPALLFTGAVKNVIFQTYSHGLMSEYAGYYRNGASGNIFQNRDWGNPFNNHYRSYLINLAEVMRLTENEPLKRNQFHMARIVKAMTFQQLTDAYGDIPYFDAVKGVDDANIQPRFDTQEAIYRDLLKELKEAYDGLDNSATQISFGNADLLYKGNVDAWKRFANSLRLRMALRVRYADAGLAREHISDALTRLLITNNAENARLTTLNDGNTSNINEFFTRNSTSPNNMIVSFTVTDNLKRLDDPRLPLFARLPNTPAAGYRGVPLQISPEQQWPYQTDSVARMAPSFLQPVLDIVAMNAGEVYLLRAEAALAGFSAEDPQSLFAQGIKVTMEQYGVASGDIESYLSSPAGILAGTDEEKLEQISVQKWLATYYNQHEGWAEFRRTGYPRIWTGNVPGDTEGNVPRRLTYPIAESLRNETNLAEAVARLAGGDRLMSRVWWDKKPGVPFAHPRQGMFPPEQ